MTDTLVREPKISGGFGCDDEACRIGLPGAAISLYALQQAGAIDGRFYAFRVTLATHFCAGIESDPGRC